MVQKKEMAALFIAASLVAISSLAHYTNAQSSGGPHPVCVKWQQECVQLQAQKKPCPPPPTCTESIGTGTCAGAICVGEKAKTQGGEEEALDKDLSKLKEAVKEAAPGGGSSGGSGSGGGQQGGQQSEPKASEPVDRSVQETLDNTYDYSPSERGEPGGGKSVADEIAEYAKLPVGGSEGGATEVGGGAQSASELHPDDVGGLDTWSPSGDQGAQGGADEKNPSFAENTFGNGNVEANPEDRGPFERAFDAVRDWAGQKLEDLGDAAGKMAEDIYQEVFGEEEKATVEPQATPREAYQQAYRSCASGGGGFSECSAAGRAAYDAASTAAPVAAPPVEPLLGLGTGRQTEGLTADRSGLDSTQGGAGEPVTGWNAPRIDTNDLVEQVASDLAPPQDMSGVGQPLEELQQRLAQEAPEVPTPDAQADIQQQAPGEQGATKQEGSLRESLQKAIQDFSAGMDRFAKEVEGMREGLLMTGEKGGNREGLPTNPERLVQAAQMNPDLSITGQAGPSPRTALPGEGAQGEPGFSLIDAPADVAPIDGGNSAVGNPDLDNQLTEPSVEDVAGLPPIEQLQERLAQGAPEVPTPTQAEVDAAPKPQEQGLLDKVWEGVKDGAKTFGELVQDGLRNLADGIISPAEAQPWGKGRDIIASTYGWDKGSGDSSTQPLASGSSLDKRPWVFAERSGKFGEKFMFTNPATGESVVLERADRGPYTKDASGNYARDIDLSRAAAEEIGQGYTVKNIRMTPVSSDTPLGPVSKTSIAFDSGTAALPAGFAERAVPASLNYSSPLLDTPVPGEIIGNPLSYENAAAGPSFTPSANDAVPAGLSYSPQQPTFTAIEVPAPDMSVNNPFTMSEGLRSALQEAGDSINRNFADTGRALTEYFANNPGPNNSLGESLTYQNTAREADQAARDYFSNYPGADNAFAERLNYDGVGQPIEQLQKRLAQSAPEVPFEGGDYAPTQPVDTQPIEDILRARWESARSKYADETSLPGVLADAFGLRTPPESLRLARDAEGAYTDFVSGEIMGRAAAPPVSQRNDDTARVVSSDGGTQDPAADVPFVQDTAPSAPERNSAADALAEAFAGEERFPSYPPHLPTDRSVERTALPEPGTPEFFEQQLDDAKEARRAAEARWVENRSLAQRVGDSLGLTTSPEYTAKSAAEDAYNKAWRDSWDYVTESLQERGVLGRELASLPAYSDAANRELADSVNITNAPPSDYAPSGDPDIDNLGGAPSAEEIPLNTQPLPTPRETGQAIQTALQNALKNMWGEELSNVPAAEPELTTRPALADVPNSFTRDLGVTSERLSAIEHGEGTDRLAADYGDGSSRIDPKVDIDNLGGAPSAEDVNAALAAREPQVDTPSGSSNDPAALSRVPEWAKWSKEFADFARGAPEAVAEAVRDAVQPVWDSVARNAEALFASQKPPVFENVPETPVARDAGAAEFERSGEGTGGGLRAEAPQREAEYDARRAAEKARETPRVAGFAQGTEPAPRPGADATNFSEWNKQTGQNLTRADREQLWKQSGAGSAYRATEEQNSQLLNYVKREAGVGTTPRLGAPTLSTEAPAVGGAGSTLSQWFGSRGESLPSLSERRALYTTFYGLGTSYSGTAAQNAQLLKALKARY